MKQILILTACFAMALSNMFATCEVEAEASFEFTYSLDLPECAPVDVQTFDERMQKFSDAYNAYVDNYNDYIAELAGILGVSASSDAIISKINNAVSSETSCRFEIVANLSAEYTGSAAIDNDEAQLMSSGSLEASITTEWVCETTTTIEAPFDNASKIAQMEEVIAKLQVMIELGEGMQAKANWFADQSVENFETAMTNACPQDAANFTTLVAQMRTAKEKSYQVWGETESIINSAESINAAMENSGA